jgi:hypothetical protein
VELDLLLIARSARPTPAGRVHFLPERAGRLVPDPKNSNDLVLDADRPPIRVRFALTGHNERPEQASVHVRRPFELAAVKVHCAAEICIGSRRRLLVHEE